MIRKILIPVQLLFLCTSLFAQSELINFYRNEPKGDIQYRRESIMEGNRVRTLFDNCSQVGHWPNQPSAEWPKGSGHSYEDGICVLIAAEVTAPGNGAKIHPLETYYREWIDEDPLNGKPWSLTPVPGYMSLLENNTKPAMSNYPSSWPEFWPDKLTDTTDRGWAGKWSGYFGKGLTNSDFETFYVMDDSKDAEYTRLPFQYFPLASDHDRGGLGIRVETRGFQWSHVLAEDIIFWHYDIVNLSDFDYPTAAFGFYTDAGVGGTNDSGDDCASYDVARDITYAYDGNGRGVPDNWPTGLYGYAYLESPGNASNGVDDDNDGMTDETRDNGIDDDHDWVGYTDLNGNGQWDVDANEPLNDDVGLDGIGPLDEGYTGKDEGEGDGIPTSGAYPVATRFPGEPGIDKTDKDESDQIGLTAVSIYRLGDGGVGGGWPKDDETMWLKMVAGTFDTSLQNSNISIVFASGPFPLYKEKRERYSMALLFGSNLEELLFSKETVQEIYNANYNFSKPPKKPLLTAVAGDKQVSLFWDDKAENSYDRFLKKYDFEGYCIYKSTEAQFEDVKLITDSQGNPQYSKPVAQFDIIDTIYVGPDPVGINGAHFWRGKDTGLKHSFIDTEVQNGQRYFYAITSYDKGDPNYGTRGLQPTECTKIISEDFAGNIQFVDVNCAVVTPNSPAAGYIPPSFIGDLNNVADGGLGTGKVDLQIYSPADIITGATYKLVFNSTGTFPNYSTSSLDIHRIQNGQDTILVQGIDTSYIGADKSTTIFDGMSVTVINDTLAPLPSKTNWLVGTSNLDLSVLQDNSTRGLRWPSDYTIEFGDSPMDTSIIEAAALQYKKMPVNFRVKSSTTGLKNKIATRDIDQNGIFNVGDEIHILEFTGPQTLANTKVAWKVLYGPPLSGAPPIEPVAGDKYFIKIAKPFFSGDNFSFTINPPNVNADSAKNQLGRINVVPNPYLGAASWERRNLNNTGRGERRIDFINLPSTCTVRIYTITGALIKELHKEYEPGNGALSWNMVTEDGMDIAYGVYIYHVDAPGIGEHIGKFAVIK